jgi:hypothetical protein
MRQEADFFTEPELKLIYLARTLRDSLKLEDILTKAGIDYLVETGPYTAGFLIKRDLTGVYFYVAPDVELSTREILVANKYKPFTG